MKALQRRGFVFEEYTESYVTTQSSHNHFSSTFFSGQDPPTPPATTSLVDLEERTFTNLRKQNVTSAVDPTLQLILCAGHRSSRDDDAALKYAVTKCLVIRPRFISITLTDTEPMSLFLEKDFLMMFPEDTLLGRRDEILIPIMLDFRALPEDATGIVCGVAGRLMGSTKNGKPAAEGYVEMSYLSTAKAGTVIVSEPDLDKAVEALKF